MTVELVGFDGASPDESTDGVTGRPRRISAAISPAETRKHTHTHTHTPPEPALFQKTLSSVRKAKGPIPDFSPYASPPPPPLLKSSEPRLSVLYHVPKYRLSQTLLPSPYFSCHFPICSVVVCHLSPPKLRQSQLSFVYLQTKPHSKTPYSAHKHHHHHHEFPTAASTKPWPQQPRPWRPLDCFCLCRHRPCRPDGVGHQPRDVGGGHLRDNGYRPDRR